MSIVIDEEFKSLIPPLSPEEYKQLEENCVKEGIRDALVVWELRDETDSLILLDGHNRWNISAEHAGIPFKLVRKYFDNRNEAKAWIIKNQLGRRNLNREQRQALIREMLKEAPEKSDRQIAKELQVSPSTVGAARHELEESGQVSKLDTSIGTDGKEYPRQVQKSIPESKPEPKEEPHKESDTVPLKEEPTQAERISEEPEHVPHVMNNSGDYEWYTPEHIINAARSVLERIDTDPASCETANVVVKAEKYYDIETDGLNNPWNGHIWLNPPYAAGLVEKFVDKLEDEIDEGNVTEFIALVNNATETQWFRKLASMAITIAFPMGRIKYWSPDKKSKTPLQGQAILYGGTHYEAFEAAFMPFCMICDISKV